MAVNKDFNTKKKEREKYVYPEHMRSTRVLSIWSQDVFSSNNVTTTSLLTSAVTNKLTNLLITNQ